MERLDSWKAIAKYLDRDVSTVRRWEKTEGLPVHRHLHQKLGSVYAFPSELDNWKNGRRADAARLEPPAERPTLRRFLIPSLITLTGIVIAALLYSLAGVRAGMRLAHPGANTRGYAISDSRYARNTEVYELWLRGRYHWHKRTPEGFTRAIQAFSRAIEKDPTFAPAYAGLADTYTVMGYFSQLIPPEEARSKARAAAVKALALDDSLAEAHTSMASVLEFEQWDWAGAEREYRRAIQLAPNYATAYHWYANNLSTRGRHEEAIACARRAVELDPLSPVLHVALAHAYLLAGQNDEALDPLSKALEIEPASANAHLFLGMTYSRQARYDKALDETLTANRLFENWVWKAFLADLYMRMDRRDEAQRIVRAFETHRPAVSRVTAAAIYSAVGERQRSLELLRGAFDARDPDITFLKSVPAFDRLREDPEFQALLRRSGLS